ncbi:hypothetical protein ACHAQF_000085 [Verticillium nonalfalfae]
MQGAAQNDEALGLVNPAEWDGFVLELADSAPEILGAAVQVLKTQTQKNKFAIMVAAAGAAGAWAVSEGLEPLVEVAHKFVFGDEIVTTYLGKETTVCPDATATMTGIQDGTPTAEPSCYPTHGPEHSDPVMDELIKICNADKSDFAAVCRSNTNRNIEVRCHGQRGPWEPVSNNKYFAWFKPADKAPEDCRYLFGDNDAKDDDAVGARVDALCIPAFEAIKKKCSWNGGEVKNQCGTFVALNKGCLVKQVDNSCVHQGNAQKVETRQEGNGIVNPK